MEKLTVTDPDLSAVPQSSRIAASKATGHPADTENAGPSELMLGIRVVGVHAAGAPAAAWEDEVELFGTERTVIFALCTLPSEN